MSDPIAVAEDNYLATYQLLPSLVPAGVATSDEGVVHIRTGARIPTFNLTIAATLPDDTEGLLDAATTFHAEHESPVWMVAVRAPDAQRFAPAAKSAGFTHADDEPFMVLDPIPPSTLPDGLSVRRADDFAAIELHFDLVARGFGMPIELIEMIVTPALLDDRIHCYIGEIDGAPVTTSMLCVSSGTGPRCAGVYNVATLESHRRQGLGEAMTAHAAEVGRREHGCTVATLQSSAMGYPVYERMGYREVTSWQFWAPPRSSQPTG